MSSQAAKGMPSKEAPLARGFFGQGRLRLDFLDALRGLAALYVVIYHMILLPQPNLQVPRWAEKFAHAGGTGVTLFFIVSAFSLYYTMPLRERDGRLLLSFYLHRFFRIAPLFYFLIVVSMVRDYWEFGVLHSATDILLLVSFAFNLFPGEQEGFVWAGWTIGVEMVFYAFFPLIYKLVRNTGNAVAFTFASLLAWMVLGLALDYIVMPQEWKQSILQWSTFRHFPIFAVGAVVYHLFVTCVRDRETTDGLRPMGNALLVGGIFTFAALLQGWLPNLFGDSYYWQGVAFGLLFLGLAFAPWRVLVNSLTSYLGKISYSVYLTHTTAIYFLAPVYHAIYDRSSSMTVGFLGSLLLTLIVVLPVSALTYRFIEVPGINLGKRLMKTLKAPHPEAHGQG